MGSVNIVLFQPEESSQDEPEPPAPGTEDPPPKIPKLDSKYQFLSIGVNKV